MNAKASICISDEQLLVLVSARVDQLLTPEVIEHLAAERIDARIRRLTLEEAMPRLGCRNVRQLKDKLHSLGIKVRKDLGQKCQYVLLADIEARQTSRSVVVPFEESRNGTRIGSLREGGAQSA